jgi:hypothetical protein
MPIHTTTYGAAIIVLINNFLLSAITHLQINARMQLPDRGVSKAPKAAPLNVFNVLGLLIINEDLRYGKNISPSSVGLSAYFCNRV